MWVFVVFIVIPILIYFWGYNNGVKEKKNEIRNAYESGLKRADLKDFLKENGIDDTTL